MTIEPFLAALLGYVLGSIPFGLILARVFGAGDVRQIGSGSIGATNVLRTGRKGLAGATVLLDAGKGAAAVALAGWLFPGAEYVAGVASVVGHCFPVFIGFRGGKGFATAAGVCLVIAWPAFLASAAVWALALALSRISSVSSMLSVTVAPIAAWLFGIAAAVLPLVAIAAIVLVRHRPNIERLVRGEEPRVGGKA